MDNKATISDPATSRDMTRAVKLNRLLLLVILGLQSVILYQLFWKDVRPPAAGSPVPPELTRVTPPELSSREATPAANPLAGVRSDDPPPLRRPGAASFVSSHAPDNIDRIRGDMRDYLLDVLRNAPSMQTTENPEDYTRRREFLNARMDRMFELALGNLRALESDVRFDEGWSSLHCSPTMDMRDQDDRYVVQYCLPGLVDADINVMLEGRLLTISSSSSQPGHPDGRSVRFERRLWLPGPVAPADDAQAFLTNGVLTVLVPKSDLTPATVAAARLM